MNMEIFTILLFNLRTQNYKNHKLMIVAHLAPDQRRIIILKLSVAHLPFFSIAHFTLTSHMSKINACCHIIIGLVDYMLRNRDCKSKKQTGEN